MTWLCIFLFLWLIAFAVVMVRAADEIDPLFRHEQRWYRPQWLRWWSLRRYHGLNRRRRG